MSSIRITFANQYVLRTRNLSHIIHIKDIIDNKNKNKTAQEITIEMVTIWDSNRFSNKIHTWEITNRCRYFEKYSSSHSCWMLIDSKCYSVNRELLSRHVVTIFRLLILEERLFFPKIASYFECGIELIWLLFRFGFSTLINLWVINRNQNSLFRLSSLFIFYQCNGFLNIWFFIQPTSVVCLKCR